MEHDPRRNYVPAISMVLPMVLAIQVWTGLMVWQPDLVPAVLTPAPEYVPGVYNFAGGMLCSTLWIGLIEWLEHGAAQLRADRRRQDHRDSLGR